MRKKKLDGLEASLQDLLNIYIGQELKSISPYYGTVMLHIGTEYLLLAHDQECCESVDFINSNIVIAVSKDNNYTLEPQIIKDITVTRTGLYDCKELTTINIELSSAKDRYNYIILQLQWLGESNGYYSTGIDLFELDEIDILSRPKKEQLWPNLH